MIGVGGMHVFSHKFGCTGVCFIAYAKCNINRLLNLLKLSADCNIHSFKTAVVDAVPCTECHVLCNTLLTVEYCIFSLLHSITGFHALTLSLSLTCTHVYRHTHTSFCMLNDC